MKTHTATFASMLLAITSLTGTAQVVVVEPRIEVNATNTPGNGDAEFRITAPGSYYLPDNIAVSNKTGIEIAGSDVTLDLMGNTIAGVDGPPPGVEVVAGVTRIVIRNGKVRDCSSGLKVLAATEVTLEDLNVSGCTQMGIAMGARSTARRCVATGNTLHGIHVLSSAGTHSRILDCEACDNSQGGIAAGPFTTIVRSLATGNAVGGFVLSADCVVSDCIASQNTTHGIASSTRCQVLRNVCSGNGVGAATGSGIFQMGGGGARIEGNTCNSNDTGINIAIGGNILLLSNSATGNTTNYIQGAASGLIITAAQVATNTNPNANISH